MYGEFQGLPSEVVSIKNDVVANYNEFSTGIVEERRDVHETGIS